MTAVRITARVASSGVVRGTLRREVAAAGEASPPAGGIAAAIVTAAGQLRALQDRSEGLASDILEFQIELLEDDHFVLQLLRAIEAGDDPATALSTAFGEQIAVYERGSSEHFAARAADLADLRDRLLAALRGGSTARVEWPEGTVLAAENLTPSRFLELDRSRVVGIVDSRGSAASHVALLARSEGVPMLVEAGAIGGDHDGHPCLLDGEGGRLVIDPERADLPASVPGQGAEDEVPASEGEGAATLPGGDVVEVHLIVNALDALDRAPPSWFDGIGLVRSELLIRHAAAVLDVAQQATLYRPLFEWAAQRPVTIRLLDGGADKHVPGYAPPAQGGGFLGIRGARLLLQRREALEVQLKAILAAAQGRPVRILVPMVTVPEEMRTFRQELARAIDEAGATASGVELGMMVETPAAALRIADFDADFYALGTNDLTQYVYAAGRESDVLPASDQVPEAVLQLVEHVIDHARCTGRKVSLCGDVAVSVAGAGQFLDCGLRSFCVPWRVAPRLKQFVRTGQ